LLPRGLRGDTKLAVDDADKQGAFDRDSHRAPSACINDLGESATQPRGGLVDRDRVPRGFADRLTAVIRPYDVSLHPGAFLWVCLRLVSSHAVAGVGG
jgi:hypothetical protein